MISRKKIACIIPARLNSSRFPRKVLSSFNGKPLLLWVWEAAHKTHRFDSINFAIDSEETASLIKSFGGSYIMTPQECQSGTDRIIHVMNSGEVDADVWVNWQGDEPFITSQMIGELLQSAHKDEDADVWTLKKRIINNDEINSIHFAKVVCDSHNYAIYFSRAAIPLYRNYELANEEERKKIERVYFKHVGIYAFTKKALIKISQLSPCYIEDAEQLEQLRFLYHGLRIKVHQTEQEVIGIDLPEHLKKASEYAKEII